MISSTRYSCWIVINFARYVWINIFVTFIGKLDIYHIYVTTADKKGAGTDANVYIDIHGEEGETGELNPPPALSLSVYRFLP